MDVDAGQTVRIRLSTPAANAANEIYVRLGDAPTVLVHDYQHAGPLQANQELLIPTTEAGTYYVLIRGQSQPAANTPVQLLAESLPFQITDIVQDQGGDSRYVTATILGAQFASSAIVKLVRPGFAEIEPVRYRVVDSTRIVAVFDFRSAPHGLYDVTVINPNGQQAHLPYRFLVETALEPDVIIGLGGTRVMWAGDTGFYGLSLINPTNVDLPYVAFQVGLIEQGISPHVFYPYTTFSNNLYSTANLAGVAWDKLGARANTAGYELASGYAIDLVNRGFAGLNFSALTYEGQRAFGDEYPPPRLVGFTYDILAAATPLTTGEFIARQRLEAEKLRRAIVADMTASPVLRVLAADAGAWGDLYLTALSNSGLLRPEDTPPAARTEPILNSLMSVLAAGILAGPGGSDLLVGGDLTSFFDKIHAWYGDKPRTVYAGSDPHKLSDAGQVPPTLAEFDLHAAAATHFQTFEAFVRYCNRSGCYLPDQPEFQETTPLQLQQLLAGRAQQGLATLLGPLGQGSEQYLPAGQTLPFTLQFQNPGGAASHVAELTVVTQLDEDLDLFSFRIGDMRLGDITVQIQGERGAVQREFDFRQSRGFLLRVTAGIDLPTRTATWRFQAIDPNTGELIQDPNKGFLPADASGSNAGFVSWTVEASDDATSGSSLESKARVVFNNSPPQDSNTLRYIIDSIAPVTTITATRLGTGSNDYMVQWQSSDLEINGAGSASGVKNVTVYVSIDGGDYRIWQRQTTETQAVYRGQLGQEYRFLALATDVAGNRESAPAGATTPNDGSGAELGALPAVGGSSTNDEPPPAPPPPQLLPPRPLFVAAQQGIPAAPPATKPAEFQSVLRPFAVNAFATGIGGSRAGIGPTALAELPDGTFLAAGGAGRNQIFHLPREGGAAGTPLAALPYPIYALALDQQGRLWATTGGGPLLRLDPASGTILGQFGDAITQAIAVEPGRGRIFASSGDGIEIFDPTTGRFSHFSNERVGSLAFAPDGTLWAARWPRRNAILSFDSRGKAQVVARFESPIDSLAFGQTATPLAGLLFVSSNRGELFLIDVNTRQQLVVARGGSRGDVTLATSDGRLLISQSRQIDVLRPIVAPRVLSVNPPPGVTIALPLASISVTFDQEMYADNAFDPRSVLHPANYQLRSDAAQLVPIVSVAYDPAARTATIRFEPLAPGSYELTVRSGIMSNDGLALAAQHHSDFIAISDLSSVLDMRFVQSRSDRATGTVSFDVAVRNLSGHRLLLPLILQLSPTARFDGEPSGPFGRADDGSWLIDLSENFPANGILERGQSTSGRTVTVRVPTRRPVTFDPAVAALPTSNSRPQFLTFPVTNATAAQTYYYYASAADENGDDLSYLLVRGPTGMTIDAESGLITWTPPVTSPEAVDVAIQVYDTAGANDTQAYLLNVDGVNRRPVFSLLAEEIEGREGERLEIGIHALDSENDPLTYWADHLPPGAVFDADRQLLVWTPTLRDAGTYQGVTFAVSDGRNVVLTSTTLVIAPSDPAIQFLQPPDLVIREGETAQLQLQATDPQGLPLTFASQDLPPGAAIDPKTGIFTWTPDYTQHGLHVATITADNGLVEATQRLGILVLNVNAAPVFLTLPRYDAIEGQELQIRADARDPDNLLFTPPDRLPDGALATTDPGVSTLTMSAIGLPPGAAFDPRTQILRWTPDYGSAGPHIFTFTATDDGDNTGTAATSTATFVVHVRNVNRPPQLQPLGNRSVERGTILELPVQSSDPDGNPIVLAASGMPGFGSFTDNGDGSGLFRFSPDYGDRGNYAVTLRATDNGDGDGSARQLDSRGGRYRRL